jgi:putative endonuclease
VRWPFGRTPPLGRRGELLARKLLRRAGLKILAANYRCPAGEVDLIALDRATRKARGAETIVFVEVKTRSAPGRTAPETAVDARKRRQIQAVADYYLRRRGADDYRTRFDVVAVVLPEGGEPQITHIRDAF